MPCNINYVMVRKILFKRLWVIVALEFDHGV
jgi:hypothetical protein